MHPAQEHGSKRERNVSDRPYICFICWPNLGLVESIRDAAGSDFSHLARGVLTIPDVLYATSHILQKSFDCT